MGRHPLSCYIKNMRYTGIIAVLFLALTVTVTGQTRDSRDQAVDTLLREIGIRTFDRSVEAVNFDLPLLDGTRSVLNDHRGSFVFLNFWATWCPPCREEMPAMEELQRSLADLPFTILAVSVQEDPATVSRFIDQYGFTFPILLDRNGRVTASYGVRGLPTSYFIAPDGRVAGMIVGILPWDDPAIVSRMRQAIEHYRR